MARHWIEVTEVRVQRVQDIDHYDAKAEGVESEHRPDEGICADDGACLVEDFRTLWDSINAKRGFAWDANPWVYAITFKKVGKP